MVLIIEPLKRLLFRTFRGSKYVALIEPFKILYRTFSSKSVGGTIQSQRHY